MDRGIHPEPHVRHVMIVGARIIAGLRDILILFLEYTPKGPKPKDPIVIMKAFVRRLSGQT